MLPVQSLPWQRVTAWNTHRAFHRDKFLVHQIYDKNERAKSSHRLRRPRTRTSRLSESRGIIQFAKRCKISGDRTGCTDVRRLQTDGIVNSIKYVISLSNYRTQLELPNIAHVHFLLSIKDFVFSKHSLDIRCTVNFVFDKLLQVNAAHLKALERKDMIPKVGVQWNSVLNSKTKAQPRQRSSLDRQSAMQISSEPMPRNTHEFRQAWKGLATHEQRFQLLRRARYSINCFSIFTSMDPR